MAANSSRVVGAARSARAGYDRAFELLERLVPLAARLERALRWFAFTVVAAALVIVATVVVVDVPGTSWTWGLLVLLLLLLLVAPAVILVFTAMLREALELPSRLRSLPDVAPSRARELADIARQAKQNRREAPGALPRDTWRAGRLVNALRKEVPGVSVLLSLARLPFLALVLGALVIGFGEVLLAPFVVMAALVSSVL